MALPVTIQKAADYADALERQLASEGNPETATAATAPVTEPQDDPRDLGEEMEKLRSRYSTLQGKYNSETSRLAAQNKELEERLTQMSEEFSRFRQEAAQHQAPQYLTEKDANEFGDDMVDFVRRGAREEFVKAKAETDRLRSEFDSMSRQLESAKAQVQEDRQLRFEEALTHECPGWREQNQDQEFIAWLEEADPVLGVRRMDALRAAAGRFDSYRVAKIFNQYRTFRQQKSVGGPLARQVTPGRASSTGNLPSEGRVWTQAAIGEFYDKCRRGEYTPEQKRQIEQEIDNAVATGQVRP